LPVASQPATQFFALFGQLGKQRISTNGRLAAFARTSHNLIPQTRRPAHTSSFLTPFPPMDIQVLANPAGATYRWIEVQDGETARKIEEQIRKGALKAGMPLLKPL
jgi:hypothetical protein